MDTQIMNLEMYNKCYNIKRTDNDEEEISIGSQDTYSQRSLTTTRYMSPIAIITGMGTYRRIIKCQLDIGAYAKIALCNYQLLKSLSMELTNLILNGMMKKWAGLCHLNKCPLSVATLFKIPYIKNVESGDSEEGDTA